MQGHGLLHYLIKKSSVSCHQKRMLAVTNAVGALLVGKRLTLTALGRSSSGAAKERHAIRKIDRLLGNKHLHQEQSQFYKFLCSHLMRSQQTIGIIVDWSCVNKKKNWYILRASIALKGRSLTIYQEVYPSKMQNSPVAEKRFLYNLKNILPKNVKPIIITDAGFRGPWFKAVSALGFDWIGRVRNKNYYRTTSNSDWDFTANLFEKAKHEPMIMPKIDLSKSNTTECTLVLIKKKLKGRVNKNRNGNRTNNNASNRCADREREPWLLATSLSIKTIEEARKFVLLYEKRMQIEEDFRDTKSHQYGFGLRYSLTNCAKRIAILLLIAVLASLVCWLVTLSAQRKNLHIDYQSNSIRHRTVLSVTYLACQLIRKKIFFCKKELLSSLNELKAIASTEAV
jgi:hypothetical protein